MNIKPISKEFFASPFQSRIVAVFGTKENLCPVSRHMPFSSDPFLYGISFSRKTYTSKIIKKDKIFSLQFFTSEYRDEIHILGKNSGAETDKLQKSNFTFEHCEDLPIATESFAGMILEKKEILDFGDHYIVVGEPIKYWAPEEKGITENKPLLYYGRGWYGEGGNVERVKR